MWDEWSLLLLLFLLEGGGTEHHGVGKSSQWEAVNRLEVEIHIYYGSPKPSPGWSWGRRAGSVKKLCVCIEVCREVGQLLITTGMGLEAIIWGRLGWCLPPDYPQVVGTFITWHYEMSLGSLSNQFPRSAWKVQGDSFNVPMIINCLLLVRTKRVWEAGEKGISYKNNE